MHTETLTRMYRAKDNIRFLSQDSLHIQACIEQKENICSLSGHSLYMWNDFPRTIV